MTEERVDYLPAVRAIVKMSSSLNEADLVEMGKYFKFRFKKLFKEWMTLYETASKPLMDEFMKDNEKALQDAYVAFDDYSGTIRLKDDEKTDLVVFYCKIRSSLNDLSEFNMGRSFIVYVLNRRAWKMIEELEKQYGFIHGIRDADGDSIQTIISEYDRLGKAMFINKEEEHGVEQS
jgi:hypothetical protein